MIYYRYVELYLREQGDCVPGNVMADYKRPANMCVCVRACVRVCVFRSINCPQHTEDQRQSLRRKLLCKFWCVCVCVCVHVYVYRHASIAVSTADRPMEVPLASQKRKRERPDTPDGAFIIPLVRVNYAAMVSFPRH